MVGLSKVGYRQGRNFDLSQKRVSQGELFDELVPYAKGQEHCIHPSSLICDHL